jgi:hypothetical protein
MRMIVAAVALVFTISAASAQLGATLGDCSCGEWIEARTEKAAHLWLFEEYVQELLNQFVRVSNLEFWNAGGVPISSDQVFLWIDNYCRTNPLSNPGAGATALINERTNGAWDRQFPPVSIEILHHRR